MYHLDKRGIYVNFWMIYELLWPEYNKETVDVKGISSFFSFFFHTSFLKFRFEMSKYLKIYTYVDSLVMGLVLFFVKVMRSSERTRGRICFRGVFRIMRILNTVVSNENVQKLEVYLP